MSSCRTYMKTTNINFNMGLGVLYDTTEGSCTLYGALLHISTSVHRFKFIFNIALLNSISFEFALCLYIYSLHFLINIYNNVNLKLKTMESIPLCAY